MSKILLVRHARVAVGAVAAIGLVLGGIGVVDAVTGGPAKSELGGGQIERDQLRTVLASSTGSCGVERWPVKTGIDADAGLINLNATQPTTIAQLDALPAPSNLPQSNRVQPTETTVFVLNATLTVYKIEQDSDYHLVLTDGQGHTMITEIPDPACVGSGSPLLNRIRNARSEFDARFSNVTGSFQTANVPVQVTGVGFFDFLHGQTGVAPNGVELHAVLDVQFNPGPPPTTTTTVPSTTTTVPSTTTTVPSTTTTVPSTTTTTTGGGGRQLLGNAGFEQGATNPSPWSATPQVITNSTAEPARSGQWDAWLDGYGAATTDTLSQAVSIPANGSARLVFWLHIDTAETSKTKAYDTLTLQVLSPAGAVLSTLGSWSNLNAAAGYHQQSFSLSRFAGQQVVLKFAGVEDYEYQTSFVIDDASLTAA